MSAVNIKMVAEVIGRVAINRPEKRNALNAEVRQTLISELPALLQDESVQGLVLTGEGGHFCAGGDIASMEGLDAKTARKRMKDNHQIVRMIVEAEKPVITAIEGFAVGAGAGLAMLGDTAVIGESGTIGFPFFRVGLIPDYGILHTLPRRAGWASARQILLYAKMLQADEALALGLVDDMVADGKAETIAVERALSLAEMPPFAFSLAKQQLGLAPVKLEEALEMEALAQASCFSASEFPEGFKAFIEKRPPIFRR